MKTKLSRFAIWIGAAACLAGCAKPTTVEPPVAAQTGAALYTVHQAVFDCFLPTKKMAAEIGGLAEAAALREKSWGATSKDGVIIEGLKWLAASGFQRMSEAERMQFLQQMQTSGDSRERNLALALRLRYLNLIYGSPVGYAIAGVPAETGMVVAADAAKRVAELRAKIPVSMLRWASGRGEISDARGNIDVVIVGSGPAGAVLARELRAVGKRVVLIEQGPLVVPGAVNGRGLSDLLESGGARMSADGGVRFSNGQAVGGGTTVNIDLAFSPMLPAVSRMREKWRSAGLLGPLFSESRIGEADAWVRAQIGTRSLFPAGVNANNQILWEGAVAEGHTPALYALNTFAPAIAGAKPRDGVTDKRSAVEGLILNALCDGNNALEILPETKAVRIVFEDAAASSGRLRRAVGVEVEAQPWKMGAVEAGVLHDPGGLNMAAGTRALLRAKQVILCAGALGTPMLLMNSGLKNDAIGRGIVAHPSMPVIGLFDHEIRALEGTRSSVYVGDFGSERGFMLESTSAAPAYVALMTPGAGDRVFEMVRGFQKLGGFGVMLIDTPDDANRVRLNEKNAAVIEYRLSDADRKRFGYAVAEAVRMMFKGGAIRVMLPTTENVLGQGDGQPVVLTQITQADLVEKNLRFEPGKTLLTSSHLQGSCKMGPTADGSVVGLDLKVWGTENVWVMDASIFPTSVGANPMQSIYAFAKVFADRWNAGAAHAGE